MNSRSRGVKFGRRSGVKIAGRLTVLRDGKPVGVSTSRCYSYYFRQMLSLCVLDVALCEPGTEVTVIWGRPGTRRKPIRATVAPAPYKRDNRRLDLTKLP